MNNSNVKKSFIDKETQESIRRFINSSVSIHKVSSHTNNNKFIQFL